MSDEVYTIIYVGLCAIFGGLWMLGAICKSRPECRMADEEWMHDE